MNFTQEALSNGIRRTLLPILFLALTLALTLGGCAPRSYVVLVPSPDGSVGQVIVKGEKGEQVLTRAGQAARTDGSAIEAPTQSDQIAKDFGEAIAARPKLPARFLLYFTNGTTLTAESVALIPRILAEAESRPVADLSVIGHTDTVYTDAYNEELALKRANRVAELLREKDIKLNSLVIEAHGKRNLLIPTPDNTYEPRNRRVEVMVR